MSEANKKQVIRICVGGDHDTLCFTFVFEETGWICVDGDHGTLCFTCRRQREGQVYTLGYNNGQSSCSRGVKRNANDPDI